jgi:hypothetical protein
MPFFGRSGVDSPAVRWGWIWWLDVYGVGGGIERRDVNNAIVALHKSPVCHLVTRPIWRNECLWFGR